MDLLAMNGHWLAIAFAFLMGLATLIYVILDGYDLGVGMLLALVDDEQKDEMIASIGPFWDANETWLVLAVGLLLVAFPVAHGFVLTSLYLPTAIMLVALILRGVSFDFRAKVKTNHKHLWNKCFFIGSLVASLTQGYMLGIYIMGFEYNASSHLFGLLCGVSVAAGYGLLGASWLIMKTTGELQKKAVRWARIALFITAFGIGIVSIATPLMSERIFAKWFSIPNIFLLAPIPVITLAVIMLNYIILRKLPRKNDGLAWVPFACCVAIFILCFHGLAYSFYPYIVPDKITIFGAASAPESLMIMFVGALLVLPFIIGYTAFAYRVFWGKVQKLEYY
jgi:cytochrome d ubiquinol oxidase subunit II